MFATDHQGFLSLENEMISNSRRSPQIFGQHPTAD